MHIYFNKEINSETVQELVNKLSEVGGKMFCGKIHSGTTEDNLIKLCGDNKHIF